MSSHTSEEDGKPGDAYRKPHGTGDTVAKTNILSSARMRCQIGGAVLYVVQMVPSGRINSLSVLGPHPSKYNLIFAQLAIREQSDKENVKRREENKKKLDEDLKMIEDKNKEAAEEDEDDWKNSKYSEDEEDEEETGRSGA